MALWLVLWLVPMQHVNNLASGMMPKGPVVGIEFSAAASHMKLFHLLSLLEYPRSLVCMKPGERSVAVPYQISSSGSISSSCGQVGNPKDDQSKPPCFECTFELPQDIGKFLVFKIGVMFTTLFLFFTTTTLVSFTLRETQVTPKEHRRYGVYPISIPSRPCKVLVLVGFVSVCPIIFGSMWSMVV